MAAIAGSAFMNTIGVISGLLGIVQFGLDNLPQQETSGAVVRIGAGLNSWSEQNMGGRITRVRGYDHYNRWLGSSDKNNDIGNGNFIDVTLHQKDHETTNARYVSIHNAKDATCVAYVATTQPNGLKTTWLGDVGYQCGKSWYASAVTVGQTEDGKWYQPKCTWFDENFDDGVKDVSMKIDTNHYTFDENKVGEKSDFDICAGTQWSDNADEITTKRSARKRPTAHDSMLVVSDKEGSSASELCDSGMSMGPDFISLREQVFCDMDQKKIYPLCSEAVAKDCFDLDAKSINLSNPDHRLVGRDPSSFNYTSVIEWR